MGDCGNCPATGAPLCRQLTVGGAKTPLAVWIYHYRDGDRAVAIALLPRMRVLYRNMFRHSRAVQETLTDEERALLEARSFDELCSLV